ncbi:hypothetical protein D1BOALGB6SA_9687 [Olavius sp. associated proteobacterium Delta 1]|nr:hypothetical protein D1BOALGB6SA_9687 [Olavius sp. associated proteobacterium Delta 1]
MTNEQRLQYSEPELLKDILVRVLKGKKFKLEWPLCYIWP